MRPDLIQEIKPTNEDFGLVSGRFLSDIFGSLERHNIPATQMLGDLPIPIDENGRVTTQPVEWADFAAFMKRLEHHVGGPSGLETCGERIGELEPAKALRSFAGFSASPYSLYRAASRWALRRATPGVETHIEKVQPYQLEIRVRIRDGLRPCPQLFHLATGAARALPRILGMRDAVVIADVRDSEANYQIMVPPSRTILSRVTRVFRTLFSASSVLQFLEAQQLELHAKYASLQTTNASLAASERRYQTITETAVDVLCEIDARGLIEYVSASVEDLMGYSPEQVTGSHFSLWVPTADRDRAKKKFDGFALQTPEHAITREPLKLLAESGAGIEVELSLRSYRTPEGELRMVGILRDQTDRRIRKEEKQSVQREHLDQNGKTALGSTIERLREFQPENSIEKSLASLLAALEASPFDHREGARDRIIAATACMTQIVESAMVLAPSGPTNFR